MLHAGYSLANGDEGLSGGILTDRRNPILFYQTNHRNFNAHLLKRHKPLDRFRLSARISVDDVGQQPGEVAGFDEGAEVCVAKV